MDTQKRETGGKVGHIARGIERLLRPDEVMEVLGVTRPTLKKLSRDGKLPEIDFGGRPRYRPSDLRALVRRSVTRGGAASGLVSA